MYSIIIKTVDTKLGVDNLSKYDLEIILGDFRGNGVIFLKEKNLYLSSKYVVSIEVLSEEEQKKKTERQKKNMETLSTMIR